MITPHHQLFGYSEQLLLSFSSVFQNRRSINGRQMKTARQAPARRFSPSVPKGRFYVLSASTNHHSQPSPSPSSSSRSGYNRSSSQFTILLIIPLILSTSTPPNQMNLSNQDHFITFGSACPRYPPTSRAYFLHVSRLTPLSCHASSNGLPSRQYAV